MLENCPLKTLYKVVLTTSVSNSTAERTFSKMKLIKTYLRNKISTQNLSNQCVIGIGKDFHPETSCEIEKKSFMEINCLVAFITY